MNKLIWLLGLPGLAACPSPPPTEGTTELTPPDCAQTWFVDQDGDGYGVAVEACEAPDEVVDVGGDCDDADPTRSPGMVEVCDGIDNDCDEQLDDWSVPEQYPTIADAVASVPGGVTICVAPGDHAGPIGFPGQAVEILGRDGAVLDFADHAGGTAIAVSPFADVTMRNLQITGVNGGVVGPDVSLDGLFATVQDASLTLDSVTFMAPQVAVVADGNTLNGGLFYSAGKSELVLRNVRVEGGAFEVSGTGTAAIRGALVYARDGSVVLDNVHIEGITVRTTETVGQLNFEGLFDTDQGTTTRITDLTVDDISIEATASSSANLWPSVLYLRGEVSAQTISVSDVHASATAPVASTGEVVAAWGGGTLANLEIVDSSIYSEGETSPTRADALVSTLDDPVELTHYRAVGNRIEARGGFARGVLEDNGGLSVRWLDVRNNEVVAGWLFRPLVHLTRNAQLDNAIIAGNTTEAKTIFGGMLGAQDARIHNVDVVGNEIIGENVYGGAVLSRRRL